MQTTLSARTRDYLFKATNRREIFNFQFRFDKIFVESFLRIAGKTLSEKLIKPKESS